MTASQEKQNTAETIRALARVVRETDTQSIPSSAMRQAHLLLLDTIGCGLAGLHEEVAQGVAAVALHDGGRPECALIGRAQRTTVLNAVLANGVAIRVLDLNDYLIGESKGEPEAAGHPSDNIPVALAVGAARGCSGAEVLASIVIGYELYARLQRLMNRDGEWDGVTVSGLVAAAMAGRLMNLNEDQLAHALALGAARAATPRHRQKRPHLRRQIHRQRTGGASGRAGRAAGGTRAHRTAPDSRRCARASRSVRKRGPLASHRTHSGDERDPSRACQSLSLRQHRPERGRRRAQTPRDAEGRPQTITRIELVMADYAAIKRHQEDKGRIRPHRAKRPITVFRFWSR